MSQTFDLSINKNRQTQINNQEYIEYGNDYIHVTKLKAKSVSPDMLNNMHMSTNSRAELPPKLTDEALIQTAERYLKQCSPSKQVAVTYDEALIHTILPELINRLKGEDST